MFSKFFNLFQKPKNEDFELATRMMRAAAEGQKISELRRAIATLDQKSPSLKDDEFTGWAAYVLAKNIRKNLNMKISDDDDFLLLGICCFVFSNHFSFIMKTQFESATYVAVMQLANSPENFVRAFNPIGNAYNSMSGSNTLQALGQTCATWVGHPSPENFERLLKLVNLMRQHSSD
jgi:hypothetical protein